MIYIVAGIGYAAALLFLFCLFSVSRKAGDWEEQLERAVVEAEEEAERARSLESGEVIRLRSALYVIATSDRDGKLGQLAGEALK